MEVGAYEAKTHLPRLLGRVERGERITITRRGKAIAELVPAGHAEKDQQRKAADALYRLGDEVRARGVRITRKEIIAWKNEGRR